MEYNLLQTVEETMFRNLVLVALCLVVCTMALPAPVKEARAFRDLKTDETVNFGYAYPAHSYGYPYYGYNYGYPSYYYGYSAYPYGVSAYYY